MNFRRLLAVLAFIACTLGGQVDTSTAIRGLVTDATGAAVVGAAVTIHNAATGEERTTVTDSTGFYSLPSVVPGTYSVSVRQPGFKRAEVTDRAAGVAQVAQVDIMLQVGEASESVTVSAVNAELIDTSSAAISGTIVSKLVDNLPFNGRNFFDLAVTLPNVSQQSLGTQVSMGASAENRVFGNSPASPLFRSSGIFAAGNRDSAVNVTIDGVNVQSNHYGTTNPQQPPSAIEEIKIQVSGMTAEFGYGVGSVNVITKSGSNRFHGEAYEYLHNEKLDANYFFSNLVGKTRPPFRQNQFGGAVGGPVIPNKLFFFAAYEGLHVRQSTFSTELVPPADLRNGDFSHFTTPGPGGTTLPVATIYNPYRFDPATGLRQPFPGNKIPLGPSTLCAPRLTCADPVTLKFLQDYGSLPNVVIDGLPELAGDTRQKLDSNQGVLRVDWVRGTATRVYGRYSQTVATTIGTGLQSLEGVSQDGSDRSAAIHWTQVISPSTVNDVTLGFSRPDWFYGRDTNVPDVSAAIGLINTSTFPGGPVFNGTGYTLNASPSFILIATDNVYHLGDDLTKVKGRHNLKFGFQATERRFYFPIEAQDKGQFNFGSPAYTQACPPGNAGCLAVQRAAGLDTGGNAFATFLLGAPSDGLFQLNGALYNGHRMYYGAYAQDSWRVNSRLTLNYGLRYDYWSAWLIPRHTTSYFNERTGQLGYVLQNPLDYISPSTDYGRHAPLTPGVPESGYTTPKANFSPRLGLAYSVTPSTVFRAGFGMYYNGNINMDQFGDIQTGIGPFRLRYQTIASSAETIPSLSVAGNYQNATPKSLPVPNDNPPYTFRFAQNHYPNETVLEWQASVQQRLGSQWATEIGYQGTHAYHLDQFIDVNAPDLPQGPLAGLSLQQRRRFPQWGILGTWAPMGFGRYNALWTTLKNNSWRGLTFLSSFTFAKNIVSSYAGASDQGNQSYRVPYMWAGPAQLSSRLRLVNSLSYDLPFGKGKSLATSSAPLNAVIGGWRVSAITDATTGVPQKVTVADNSGTGYGTMPNRVCDPRNVPGGRNRLEWFNTACFQQTAFGVWGNSPLGVYEDPGIDNINLTILRRFRMMFEGSSLEFRADMFNALNHTQWGPANASFTSGNVNYGRITATRPPRQMQVALTFRF